MKITLSQTKTFHISGYDGLDPITVFVENLETGKGKITITCYGSAWVAFWGAIGSGTIEQFFMSCDAPYLVNRLLCEGRKASSSEKKWLLNIVESVADALATWESMEAAP